MQEKVVERVTEYVDSQVTVNQVLTQILNLTHVAEFFRDPSSRTAAQVNSFAVSENDLTIICEFYKKVLSNNTESANFDTIESKRDSSVNDLTRYLNKEDSVVLLNSTYAQIQANVEKIASNPTFQKFNFKIDSKQQPPIGSEIKPPQTTTQTRKESYSSNKPQPQQQQQNSSSDQVAT